MNAIDFHSAIADHFDDRYNQSPAFRQRLNIWTAVLDQHVKAGDRVLDLGCGSGVLSHYLAAKGCVVTAVDGSPAMIDLCRRKNPSAGIRYTVQRLPFDDCSGYELQNVVVASSLLEYIDDLDTMLHQAWTLLRPGGSLIVSLPNRRSLYRRFERLLFALTGRPRYFAHVRHRSTPAVFALRLSRIGFSPLQTVYYSSDDPLSKRLKRAWPEPYVNSLFVSVYRKLDVPTVA